MRRGLVLALCAAIAVSCVGLSAGLGPVALGFHLIPSIERLDGHRAWDLSLSLGATVTLGAKDSLDLIAIIDSGPTALGTTVTYCYGVTERMRLGVGLTVLWPVTADAVAAAPMFESFARASVQDEIGAGLTARLATTLPFLTVAKTQDRWSLLPLADLPSVTLGGDIRLAPTGSLVGEMTLQPVITDTTALIDPLGRVTDELLVLPMFSLFTRYIPVP
jgi:hypothetical protein